MKAEIRDKLRALGPDLTPAMVQGTREVMAPLVPAADMTVHVARDQSYGPDERNRLDVFRKGAPSGAPVLVFVHGGGFVSGDKTSPGSPFFDNVGQWAAQQGWLGVTMTYRLAPTHRWPSGPEDIAQAVRWLHEHAASLGGDPRRIHLVGHSAGASHVGAYIAHRRFQDETTGIAGAVLISGVFDLPMHPPSPYTTAYFGGDTSAIAEAASITGLVASRVPLLFTLSEFDPPLFHDQAARLAREWHERKRLFPPVVVLGGQNHLSPSQSIGTSEDQVARCVVDFVDQCPNA